MEQRYTVEFTLKGTIDIEAVSHAEGRAMVRMFLLDLEAKDGDSICELSPESVELGDSYGENGISSWHRTPPNDRDRE